MLGLKSKLAKWEAEEKLRAHIAAQEKRPVIPDGESTFPWFWVHRFLPTRTWCPKTESLIRRIFELHVLPVIGARPLREIEKFELDVLVKKLAAHWSGSLVHKVRTYTKAAFEEAIDQGLLDRNPARKIARPATRASCRRFLSLDEITRLLDARDDRERLIARICIILGLRCSLCGGRFRFAGRTPAHRRGSGGFADQGDQDTWVTRLGLAPEIDHTGTHQVARDEFIHSCPENPSCLLPRLNRNNLPKIRPSAQIRPLIAISARMCLKHRRIKML
jgi:hypothetical protein